MIITGYILKSESKQTYFASNATFVAAPKVCYVILYLVTLRAEHQLTGMLC
jgi:hypothetical protein